MANRNKHLIDSFQTLQQLGEDCVLATIIETFGSTYQKAGARMLIGKSGELRGLLGGGCFEADLAEHAGQVFASGSAKTLFYDMRSADDAVWGLGLGCNGAVRLFLQLLKAEENFSPLNHLRDAALNNRGGLLITICESAHPEFPPGHSLFLPTSAAASQLLTGAPHPFTTAALQSALLKTPRLETHALDGQEIKAFYDPPPPPLQLLICGSGADAAPLAACAGFLGWRVTIVDHKPGVLKAERFPGAEQLLQSPPEQLADSLNLDNFSAAILMTHNLDYDARYLRAIIETRIPFIGLLGPEQRKLRLLPILAISEEMIGERLYGPVGLDIGAETPEEIALSIMAGIHAALKGRDGRPLGANSLLVRHAYQR